MKKLLCFLICIFISINVYALDLSSKNVVLYNLNDDTVVYEIASDEKVSIASLTKIMTTLVAIEHIDDMDAEVTITYDMIYDLIAKNAAVIGFKTGEKLTYKDLLYATFLPSAADGARGLALTLASSEEEYVGWMNDKAKKMGLTNTHFANVIGLDDKENYGTANEVAIMLKEALKNQIFKEMFETSEYTLTNGMKAKSSMRTSANTYHLNIDYIVGGKTGYTDDAGKCLASVANDSTNDIKYMLINIGASTAKDNAYHILDATEIYNYYFENYKYYDLVNIGYKVTSLDTIYSRDDVDIIVNKDIKYYTNEVNDDLLEITYDGVNEVKAGTKKGTKLGVIHVNYDGKTIDDLDVYLNKDISFSINEFIKAHIRLIILMVITFVCMTLLIVKLNTRRKVKIA
ncbi:MAG: D-alanyl-D-alanine carboxypeptidase [Bacilli bacterium]|nr:D-alanyl-D-alanine carboxypeptidase [Bacilli bacterium]